MFSKELFKKINFLSSSLAQARKKSTLIDPLPAYISKNLEIVKIDNNENTIFVSGAIPGAKDGIVYISKVV